MCFKLFLRGHKTSYIASFCQNIGLITQQIQKLGPQRIIVKTVHKSKVFPGPPLFSLINGLFDHFTILKTINVINYSFRLFWLQFPVFNLYLCPGNVFYSKERKRKLTVTKFLLNQMSAALQEVSFSVAEANRANENSSFI